MMRTSGASMQPGRGMDPNRGWRMVVPNAQSERLPVLSTPSANRLVDLGREMGSSPKP
jgi:hypothetical protein